jgi:hypothetical protein
MQWHDMNNAASLASCRPRMTSVDEKHLSALDTASLDTLFEQRCTGLCFNCRATEALNAEDAEHERCSSPTSQCLIESAFQNVCTCGANRTAERHRKVLDAERIRKAEESEKDALKASSLSARLVASTSAFWTYLNLIKLSQEALPHLLDGTAFQKDLCVSRPGTTEGAVQGFGALQLALELALRQVIAFLEGIPMHIAEMHEAVSTSNPPSPPDGSSESGGTQDAIVREMHAAEHERLDKAALDLQSAAERTCVDIESVLDRVMAQLNVGDCAIRSSCEDAAAADIFSDALRVLAIAALSTWPTSGVAMPCDMASFLRSLLASRTHAQTQDPFQRMASRAVESRFPDAQKHTLWGASYLVESQQLALVHNFIVLGKHVKHSSKPTNEMPLLDALNSTCRLSALDLHKRYMSIPCDSVGSGETNIGIRYILWIITRELSIQLEKVAFAFTKNSLGFSNPELVHLFVLVWLESSEMA